ncbi:MAG: crossover junction endodeoxyribonuclease RuvC [Deltaproteobacteria bacterium]|nr:crossover junction endodeoxyribonuclease RuvC [Deltaproteobacteria bacterium]MBW2082764.1 crossover junction endodeoxyribonuclease RuvC [Deltaproteobacteria bacterium]HDM09494.1 crossover junction endodeoxyribonuclease RuvC [Desulfobacteraceae bacterium]
MIVLGVDPGSRTTGYGLIERTTRGLTCAGYGYVSPPPNIPFYERLHSIFQSMVDLMKQFNPEEMAVEEVFYAKNVKSSLKLGHARGAVMIAAVQCGVKIFEYSPLEIKKAVVGYGRASKNQVRSMVKVILGLKEDLGYDTSDALAAAICHANWAQFAR